MCGIIGLLLNDIEAAYTSAAATELAEGLSLLQHRYVQPFECQPCNGLLETILCVS